jgi:nucleoredoxin
MKRWMFVWLSLALWARAQGTPSLPVVAADRGLWPSEVMVVVEHRVPVVANGKATGSKAKNPGVLYAVKEVTAKGVVVFVEGKEMTFPAADTDLLARSGILLARRAAATATPAPTATPTPVPTPTEPPTGRPSIPPPATPAAAPAAGSNALARKLDGLLVQYKDGALVPFPAANLADKKFLAIYFSASWCPPCRGFTPKFVTWYEDRIKRSKDFEVIFVSRDRSERDMEMYMANDRMSWPAVRFSQSRSSFLNRYAGDGIPCLVILDENGSVLASSYDGDTYLGPGKPLQALAERTGGL